MHPRWLGRGSRQSRLTQPLSINSPQNNYQEEPADQEFYKFLDRREIALQKDAVSIRLVRRMTLTRRVTAITGRPAVGLHCGAGSRARD
jgi:hypothetical protein